MLELVRELAAEEWGMGYAWHTGAVPQCNAAARSTRFKEDTQCRLFLSTDSGGPGLNLQVADVVMNLRSALESGPAGTADRPGLAQTPETSGKGGQSDSREHDRAPDARPLELKRSLAEGVVDGTGGPEMSLPSGRAAFLERMESLMTVKPSVQHTPAADPLDRLRDEMLDIWSDHLDLMELHDTGEQQTLVVVVDSADDTLQNTFVGQLQVQFPDRTPRLQLLEPGYLRNHPAADRCRRAARQPDYHPDTVPHPGDGQAKG